MARTKINLKGITDGTVGSDYLIPDIKMEELNDVTITSPVDGDTLCYSSNKWINKTPVVINELSELTDVNISSIADNNVLQYDNSTSKWVNKSLLKSLVFSEKIQTLGTISTSTTVNADNGSVATMTIGASLTITPSATNSGTTLTLIITNGSSYTVSWPSTILWADGTAPTLTTKDMITLFYDGNTDTSNPVWYGVSATGLATA